ncbi:MAG TPA: divalent-cation tolerance protein CutA [Rubrivivax sp.]|nr:divalent-cation tolerance protein CutA [Rubrivivax sp.]
MDGVLLVVTTVGSVEQARTLARAMVEQRLAACAQIEAIESFYRWHGAVEHDAEQRVLFKTRPDGYAALEAAIRAQHPYELPAIHAIAAAHAFAPYAAWVAACTTPAAQ